MPVRYANGVTIHTDVIPDPRVYEVEMLEAAAYLDQVWIPLEEAKEVIVQDTKNRFDAEVDLNGIPWEPLNDDYLAWKIAQGKPADILKLSTEMYQYVIDPDNYDVAGGQLFFRTAEMPAYGVYHQTGLAERENPLPQRSFFGLSTKAEAEVTAIFERWADGAIRYVEPPTEIRGLGLTSYTGEPMSLGQLYMRGPYGHVFERGAFGRITGRAR